MRIIFSITVLSALFFGVAASEPNQLAFWPLNDYHGLNDTSGANLVTLYDSSSKVVTQQYGPNGLPKSSTSVSYDFGVIGHSSGFNMTPSFTVSFYLKTKCQAFGGIFQLKTLYSSSALSINYREPHFLELWTDGGSTLIGKYSVLLQNSWTFVSISYNNESGVFNIANENGDRVGYAKMNLFPYENLFSWFDVGMAQYVGLKTTDALACFSVHGEALAPADIKKLPGQCLDALQPQKRWPNPAALVAFWPLDGVYNKTDASGNRAVLSDLFDTNCAPKEDAGPFGDSCTSTRTTSSYSYIYSSGSLKISKQFSVSMYFFSEVAGSQGGLFSFYKYFSISYKSPNYLELWNSGVLINRYPLLNPNAWNFIAVTYNQTSKALVIRNDNGNVTALAEVLLSLPSSTSVYVGKAVVGSTDYNMKRSDAVACVMYYNTTLNGDQIRQLPEVCRETLIPCENQTTSTTAANKAETTTTSRFNQPTTAYQTPYYHVETTTSTPSTQKTTTAPFTTKHDYEAPTTVFSTRYEQFGDTTVPWSYDQSTPSGPSLPWPKPQSLLGFWPLDSQYRNQDLGPNRLTGSLYYPNYRIGPFGDSNTAMEPTYYYSTTPLLQVTSSKLAIKSSFTVSFFLSINYIDKESGVFGFYDQYGTTNSFQIYQNGSYLAVSANGVDIGKYLIVRPQQSWNFVAMTFDGSTAMFTVYGKHGVVSPATYQPVIWASNVYNNYGVRLGYSSRVGVNYYYGDAVSCLMVYSSVLTASEIRQAHDACRSVHGSAPCGAPRLPLAPLPSSTTQTTLPKAGQFPYVASITYSKSSTYKCSASIIDDFWLLTSAFCFNVSLNAAQYTVHVGEHDLTVNEAQTRKHSVSKILLSGESERSLALIQLTNPIDFNNDYVNDACLFRPEMLQQVEMDNYQFVFGWGDNGRKPLVSSGLPRYVPGNILTDGQCLQTWPGDYRANEDFCFFSSSPDKNVPCSGDEGSPLLVQAPANPSSGLGDRLVQIGTYYKRDGVCSVGKPGLFASVAYQIDWIVQKIACDIPGVYSPSTCPQ